MQVLSFEYKKKKWKLIAYIVGGALLLIILLIAAITGQLQENNCDNSTTTTQTQLDSKDMTSNAKNIYAHWKQKYGATPQAAAGILGVLQLESRLDPNSVNSNSGATGLAQWLGGRKDKLEDLAHKENKPATNLGVQLDYLDQELNSSYYASNKQIFKYTDVHKATKAWLMDYEGMSKNPEQWYLSQRYGYADHWYSVLGTSDPVAGNTLDNASSGDLNELGCDSDPSYSGGSIVKNAESMKGDFYYVQNHPSPDLGSDLKNPSKTGGTDCSGFVWLALNKAGYKVPANMGWFTGTMASDAKSSYWAPKLTAIRPTKIIKIKVRLKLASIQWSQSSLMSWITLSPRPTASVKMAWKTWFPTNCTSNTFQTKGLMVTAIVFQPN